MIDRKIGCDKSKPFIRLVGGLRDCFQLLRSYVADTSGQACTVRHQVGVPKVICSMVRQQVPSLKAYHSPSGAYASSSTHTRKSECLAYTFLAQKNLFESKLTSFWLSTVDECRHNLRVLRKTVNNMLQPPTLLGADDFAKFFIDKVANIRASTSTSAAPVITTRDVPPWQNSHDDCARVNEVAVYNTCKVLFTGLNANVAAQAHSGDHLSNPVSPL